MSLKPFEFPKDGWRPCGAVSHIAMPCCGTTRGFHDGARAKRTITCRCKKRFEVTRGAAGVINLRRVR